MLYHWQVDEGQGFVSAEGSASYTGASTTALHIRAANAAQQGYIYRCTADDKGCTATSATATLTVTVPTAITDPVGGALFAISPNPANDLISVHIGQQFYVKRIIVRNATGQVVYTDSTETQSIDIRGFARGLYFITVETQAVVFNGRFLKE